MRRFYHAYEYYVHLPSHPNPFLSRHLPVSIEVCSDLLRFLRRERFLHTDIESNQLARAARGGSTLAAALEKAVRGAPMGDVRGAPATRTTREPTREQ